MKNWEHFNFEQRKIIANQLSIGAKLCEIAQLLDKDSTSVSKEIKRNRVITKKHHESNKPIYACIRLIKIKIIERIAKLFIMMKNIIHNI